MWKSTVAGIAISPTLSSFVINIGYCSKAESKYYLLFVLIQIDNRRYILTISVSKQLGNSPMWYIVVCLSFFRKTASIGGSLWSKTNDIIWLKVVYFSDSPF
jgi:hypothetical protein